MASPCPFGTSRAALEGGRVGSIKECWSRGAAPNQNLERVLFNATASSVNRDTWVCSTLQCCVLFCCLVTVELPSVECASRKLLSRWPTPKVLVPLAANDLQSFRESAINPDRFLGLRVFVESAWGAAP